MAPHCAAGHVGNSQTVDLQSIDELLVTVISCLCVGFLQRVGERMAEVDIAPNFGGELKACQTIRRMTAQH